jgi:predicted transcriptional regulator
MSVSITLDLPDDQKAELDAIAERARLRPEQVLSRLVAAAIAEYADLEAAIDEAEADFATGRFADHDTVVAESEARYRASDEPE